MTCRCEACLWEAERDDEDLLGLIAAAFRVSAGELALSVFRPKKGPGEAVTLSHPHVLDVPKFLALADAAESLGQLVQARALRAVAESMARDDLEWLAEAVNAYRRGLDERKPLRARKDKHGDE